MFEAKENSVLNLFISIAESLEGSELKKENLSKLSGKLSRAAKFLGCSEEAALFFAVIFTLQNQHDGAVCMRDIAEFLNYSFIHILEFRYVMKELEDCDFIYMNERKNANSHEENSGYKINGSIVNNVIDGTPVLHIAKKARTTEDVIEELWHIEECFLKEEDFYGASVLEYERQVISAEERFLKNSAVKNILSFFPNDTTSRIFLYALCYKLIFQENLFWSSEQDWGRWFLKLAPYGVLKRSRSFRCGDDVLFTEGFVKKVFKKWHGVEQEMYELTKEGAEKIFGKEAKDYLKYIPEENEFDKIRSVLSEMANEYTSPRPIFYKRGRLYKIESDNSKLEFFSTVRNLIKQDDYRYFLYDCVDDSFHSSSILSSTLADIYGRGTDKFNSEFRLFQEEKHPLLEEGFLELQKDEHANNATLTLGDRTYDILYGKNADIYKKKPSSKNILEPENLPAKKLFYSSEVQGQIDMLSESLEQEKLAAMQERLERKGLSKGVAAILYGAPGTGKTESVYQIAKRTNRKIMHVDIADSKSCWFGESEKQIKKIFTDYRALCRSCKQRGENAPILLFNEADAIISKRKSVESGNVAQTENAMQNILLEEMEKIEGILIATTNLCGNMDAAFERRFLFKVQFEKPSVEMRAKIWKNKLPRLKALQASALAERFDFSGGEIDNIVRKCEISEVIHGASAGIEEITSFCEKERLAGESARRIGFGA